METVRSQRLDQLLVVRGLARSRAAAAELIAKGKVTVDGKLANKASQLVGLTADIKAASEPTTASRAAHKLSGALAALNRTEIAPIIQGKDCLDLGASTGGFTEVLLNAGARQVIALDVGHNQLLPGLRADNRVIVMEGVNARYLTPEQLPYLPEIITADLSFISLSLIIPAIGKIAKQNASVLLLIKPQFEVGKELLGKGGVVRDNQQIAEAIIQVTNSAIENDILPIALIPSPLPGPAGNREFFLYGSLSRNPAHAINGANYRANLAKAATTAAIWQPTESFLPPAIMLPGGANCPASGT